MTVGCRKGKIMVNLTVRQEQRALQTLVRLVKKSKDMLPNAELILWHASRNSWWGRLTLNQTGLVYESGNLHSCGEVCFSDKHNNHVNSPQKLEPTSEVVKNFELTVADLEKHLKKLK